MRAHRWRKPGAMHSLPGPLPAMRSHRFLLAATVLAMLLPVVAAHARIRTYPASVEIGMADVIAVGTAIRFHDAASVSFALEQPLRGSIPGKELRVSLPPHAELVDADGAPPGATLRAATRRQATRSAPWSASWLSAAANRAFAVALDTCCTSGAISLAVTACSAPFSPAIPRVSTSCAGCCRTCRHGARHAEGLATMLVTDTPRVASGDDIEVSFGLKNVADAPLSLHFGGARDERSHFTLHITGPDGRRVGAQPHPELDAASLTHFFRHMSAVRTLSLAPGESTFLPSEPINTAGGRMGIQGTTRFQPLPDAAARPLPHRRHCATLPSRCCAEVAAARDPCRLSARPGSPVGNCQRDDVLRRCWRKLDLR
jgi:hypothetical protein